MERDGGAAERNITFIEEAVSAATVIVEKDIVSYECLTSPFVICPDEEGAFLHSRRPASMTRCCRPGCPGWDNRPRRKPGSAFEVTRSIQRYLVLPRLAGAEAAESRQISWSE
jgi:hypothetical protein